MREVEERELTHLGGGRGVAGIGGGERRRRGWRHARHSIFLLFRTQFFLHL